MPIKSWDATEKKCSKCKKVKPLDAFHNSKKGFLYKQGACKPCQKANLVQRHKQHPERYKQLQREWRNNNKEKNRRIGLRARLKACYGITPEEYEERLKLQEGKCCICNTDTPGGQGGFHIDHCHTEGYVRGLLCSTCNVGLGHFRDSPELLIKAANYLKITKESKL